MPKLTNDEFIEMMQKKNSHFADIILMGTYDGMTRKIKCKCKVCDAEWNPIASSLTQGTGCPQCAKKRVAEKSREQLRKIKRAGKISHEAFITKFLEKNPHANQIEICSEYAGALNSINCRCRICNLEWNTIATGLLQATGCPNCSHTSTSFMEQFLLHSLIKAVGSDNISHRNKDAIGKELDIYLPNYHLGIEIGSWKWHKAIFEKDKEKIGKCKSQNINLIVIYDSCEDNLDLSENIWSYKIDLGSEANYITLKLIVQRILALAKIETIFSKEDWDEITLKSYNSSTRVTHEDYIEKLRIRNAHFADIVLHSKYRYAKDKMLCECKKCKHKWETTASELLRGTGCPICQIKAVGDKKSKKTQIIEWRKEHPLGTKMQCEKETGISRMTVYKWWNINE